MNNTEVTMNAAQRPHQFVVIDLAIDAAALTIKLVATVPPALKSIAEQATRAAASVPANLSEGHGRRGRDRRKHYQIAYAEAREVDVHLRLLVAAGAINAQSAAKAIQLFDKVRAITWTLLHR